MWDYKAKMFKSILFPPLMAPLDADPALLGDTERPVVEAFCWPNPPFAIYSPAQTWSEPQACEIEGLNGTHRRCALVAMAPSTQTVLIQIEQAKQSLPLAFSQFRRLTLQTPVQPQDTLNDDVFSDVLGYRYMVQYQLQLESGKTISGPTVGYVETHFGLFLFTPLNDRGSVERVFIPREAFLSVRLVEPSRQADELPVPVEPLAPAQAPGSQLLESLDLTGYGNAAQDDQSPIAQSDDALVSLVNTMILEAHSRGVSAIHVESQPSPLMLRIRFRKDGVLSPYLELPPTYRTAMVARLKFMAGLDSAEHRKAQDGKIDFSKFSAHHRLALRMVTVPTENGLEDVVMRLLAPARLLSLDQLGLTTANINLLREAVSQPRGMVLCVGPSGSGKTTALHAVLSLLNTPQRKLWTAEDPIEITQADVRQVQVNPAMGWTFAQALRTVLRADPDVIMVGEMREAQTAQLAVEASLSRHVLLSSLHAPSAAEAVSRLSGMGITPFNLAGSLLAVLGLRLVRRLCTHCRTADQAAPSWADDLLEDYLRACPPENRPPKDELLAQWLAQFGQTGGLRRYHALGCSQCQGTGWSGRIGLHELMCVTPGVRRLIQTGACAELVQAEALRSGQFHTLRQDGIIKVLDGQTSLEEVRAHSNG